MPIGATISMTRADKSFLVGIFDLEFQPLVGIKRRQIVEMNLVADFFRVLEIDRIDLEQREIPLAFLGTADQAFHRIARAQAEPANLGRRYINIVGSSQIIGVGRPQEAEAVLQHLDDAFADDLDVAARQLLENRKHQLLLAHDRSVLDFMFLREGEQFGRRLELQVLQFDFLHWDEVLGRVARISGRAEKGAIGAPWSCNDRC